MYDEYHIDKAGMPTVTVSPKFQVVIPVEIREQLGLEPGEKLHVMVDGEQIQMVRSRSAKELRGAFQKLDSRVGRDPDRI